MGDGGEEGKERARSEGNGREGGVKRDGGAFKVEFCQPLRAPRLLAPPSFALESPDGLLGKRGSSPGRAPPTEEGKEPHRVEMFRRESFVSFIQTVHWLQ
jgi:hypothetical protein